MGKEGNCNKNCWKSERDFRHFSKVGFDSLNKINFYVHWVQISPDSVSLALLVPNFYTASHLRLSPITTLELLCRLYFMIFWTKKVRTPGINLCDGQKLVFGQFCCLVPTQSILKHSNKYNNQQLPPPKIMKRRNIKCWNDSQQQQQQQQSYIVVPTTYNQNHLIWAKSLVKTNWHQEPAFIYNYNN